MRSERIKLENQGVDLKSFGSPSRQKYSTSTLLSTGAAVPWIAAHGPLSYCPNMPPEDERVFRYELSMPEIFNEDYLSPDLEYHFGCPPNLSPNWVPYFWDGVRQQKVELVLLSLGSLTEDAYLAPIAIYRYRFPFESSDSYVLFQQGRYQKVPVEEQPLLEQGQLRIFRGLSKETIFDHFYFEIANLNSLPPKTLSALKNLRKYHEYIFSVSILSFSLAHHMLCMTGVRHIEKTGFSTYQKLFEDAGVDYDEETAFLFRLIEKPYTLNERTARGKFGPSYIEAIVPFNNIHLTTWFTGEQEVRVINPEALFIMNSTGCDIGLIEMAKIEFPLTRERPEELLTAESVRL